MNQPRGIKYKGEEIGMKVLNESTGRLELRKKSTEFDMTLQAELCRRAVKKAIKRVQEVCK